MEIAEAYNKEYKKYLEKACSFPSLSREADQLLKTWIPVIDYYEKIKNEKTINFEEIYGVLSKTKSLKEKKNLKQKVELETIFD